MVQGSLSSEAAQRLQWGELVSISNLKLTGNKSLLAIAIRNLIENACRYDASGAPVEVQITQDFQT
jgi:signal transduction histidine kinase